jgi:hypothetical protein
MHGVLMSYQIIDIRPPKPVLKIDSKEIKLSFITLDILNIFTAEYGGISAIYDAIEEDPMNVFTVIWQLIIDKNRFNYSAPSFYKYCAKAKESLLDITKKMMDCLDYSIKSSMPLIKNKKRLDELNKIRNIQANEAPCYAKYYDTIASRYGHDLDQFYSLTLRQLHILLKTIEDKSYDELEIQAALAGRKLKPRMEFEDISEEQEKSREEDAQDALERLKKEYEQRNKGNK